MHFEHAEHYGRHRVIRLEAGDVRHTTIVIRCDGVMRFRLRLALALMRFAARVGGFKTARLIRDTHETR